MLYGPRFLARSTISDENGRQTDMHAMPAHMALGSPSNEKISNAVETTSVSLMYHQFLAGTNIEFSENVQKMSSIRTIMLIFIKYSHAYQHSDKKSDHSQIIRSAADIVPLQQ